MYFIYFQYIMEGKDAKRDLKLTDLETEDVFESESDSEAPPKTPQRFTKVEAKYKVQDDSICDNDERACNPRSRDRGFHRDTKPVYIEPLNEGNTRSSKCPFSDDEDDGVYMGRIRPIGHDGRPVRR